MLHVKSTHAWHVITTYQKPGRTMLFSIKIHQNGRKGKSGGLKLLMSFWKAVHHVLMKWKDVWMSKGQNNCYPFSWVNSTTMAMLNLPFQYLYSTFRIQNQQHFGCAFRMGEMVLHRESGEARLPLQARTVCYNERFKYTFTITDGVIMVLCLTCCPSLSLTHSDTHTQLWQKNRNSLAFICMR